MQKNTEIYNELRKLESPLADISSINVYTVPDGYFASLSSNILQSINDQSGLDGLNIPNLTLKIPEGYFDGLADAVMDKIKSNDEAILEEYPAFLRSVQHKNVFKVPDGYFDSVAGDILNKVPKQSAKIIVMKGRPAVFRYAVAAGIAGILGLSLFSLFNSKSSQVLTPGNPVTAQVDYLKMGSDIIKNNSFDEDLQALADEDIVNYLKNNGEDVNAALVASVTDENTLPEQDAYFMDEKTLDNFLMQQNVDQSSNN